MHIKALLLLIILAAIDEVIQYNMIFNNDLSATNLYQRLRWARKMERKWSESMLELVSLTKVYGYDIQIKFLCAILRNHENIFEKWKT